MGLWSQGRNKEALENYLLDNEEGAVSAFVTIWGALQVFSGFNSSQLSVVISGVISYSEPSHVSYCHSNLIYYSVV